jgi:arylsulfatase A-like enzyme
VAIALGTCAVLALAAVLVRPRAPGGAFPPNIVLVVWDTCRADRVTPNGYSRPTTPRLEELASQGVTFRRCFTPSPWTPPAHASLFTGLLPRNHGLRETRTGRVRMGIPLLAETLRDAGYETVAFTANPVISGTSGLDHGFESVTPCYRPEGSTRPSFDAAFAVEGWVERRRAQGTSSRPLFLFVNLMATHIQHEFDAAAVEAVRGPGEVEGARRAATGVTQAAAFEHLHGMGRVDEATLRGLDASYDGAVRLDDAATGRILDALRGAGLLEGALVAVTADHGESLGEHDEIGHLTVIHEPVLAVPLVVSWPGRLDGGRKEDALVRLQDLYPTVLEAAAVPVPPVCGRDARSLAEVPLVPRILVAEYEAPADFLGEARKSFPDAPVECFARFHRSLLVVRDPAGAKYVAVRPEGAPLDARPASEELYDLQADPGETRNLLQGGGSPEARRRAERFRTAGVMGR